jgi:predicted MPP superfamily phosphohydrolase
MIDIIGDIHGHADKLEALLQKLGYAKHNGAYAHPEHTVLFVGDYIDRGPKIRETLEIVKAMVESLNALALMGNHEYNAFELY